MRFVPGFSQTAASWDAVRDGLPDEIDATALEVPDGLDFAATAAALGAAGGPGTYVGYSMGGRLCLRLALDHPEIVDALVLVSATPGIVDDAERRARRSADEQLAREVERDGAVAFLDRWVRLPMFAGVPEAAGRAARLGAGDEPRLAHQLRALGQGSQAPLWDRLDRLDLLVAFITGRDDEKYGAIADEMFEHVGNGVRLRLPGGHSLPLEQPRLLANALAELAHRITE
jgi:2-succinyl-6-hydroxy-2,4-cyclohexadiene-1-carboxylate synthase